MTKRTQSGMDSCNIVSRVGGFGRPRLNLRRLVLVSGLLLAAAACDKKAGSSSANPSDAKAGAPEVGKPAPSLAPASGSAAHDWNTLAGKVVIVDFWASWCGPCKEELPELEALYKRYNGQAVEVIGVSVDEDKVAMDDFLGRMPLSFPVVHDQGGAIAGRYNPPKMPTSYVVDKAGTIALINEGFQGGDIEKIDAKVRELLAQ